MPRWKSSYSLNDGDGRMWLVGLLSRLMDGGILALLDEMAGAY